MRTLKEIHGTCMCDVSDSQTPSPSTPVTSTVTSTTDTCIFLNEEELHDADSFNYNPVCHHDSELLENNFTNQSHVLLLSDEEKLHE